MNTQSKENQNRFSQSKKLCFIIPYFGHLPNTIQLFLDSSGNCIDTDFIIFTDDRKQLKCPKNVEIIYCQFADIRKKVQQCFDFEISLKTPKKLCDFKPAYGYIFREELSDYRFWGYCDLDMVLGRLDYFLTDEYLEQFDKLFTLGHMSIYRNVEYMNTLFKTQYSNPNAICKSYRQVFSSPHIFQFDEWPDNTANINFLAEQEKVRFCGDWLMSDILPHRSVFQESFYNYDQHQWNDGKSLPVIICKNRTGLFLCSIRKNKDLLIRELLYVHIQKRELSLKKYKDNYDNYIISPNRVVSFEEITHNIIIMYYGKMIRRAWFKPDEMRWKFRIFKGIWLHRLKTILRRNIVS